MLSETTLKPLYVNEALRWLKKLFFGPIGITGLAKKHYVALLGSQRSGEFTHQYETLACFMLYPPTDLNPEIRHLGEQILE